MKILLYSSLLELPLGDLVYVPHEIITDNLLGIINKLISELS